MKKIIMKAWAVIISEVGDKAVSPRILNPKRM